LLACALDWFDFLVNFKKKLDLPIKLVLLPKNLMDTNTIKQDFNLHLFKYIKNSMTFVNYVTFTNKTNQCNLNTVMKWYVEIFTCLLQIIISWVGPNS